MHKHTPGKWTATRMRPKDRDSDWRIVAPDSPLDIGTVYSAYSLRDEREANAKLIAAAPDLLTMLTRLHEEVMLNEAVFSRIASLTLEQARAAIAKATS